MSANTEPITAIDLRQVTEEYFERERSLGRTKDEPTGIISLTDTEKRLTIDKEPSGVYFLHFLALPDAVAEGPQAAEGTHWDVVFPPSGGEPAWYRDDEEVIDLTEPKEVAKQIFSIIYNRAS
jgi:hypothetical protein